MFLQLAAESPPAGGTAASEVMGAALVGTAAVAAVVALGVAHRRRRLLDPLAQVVERRTGLPAWSILPVGVAGGSLLIAMWGYYWDVSWHIDRGRDPGAFANPSHWFIIIGLDGIAFAGLLALFLGDDRSRAAVRLSSRWWAPAAGVLLALCGVVALAGFPLDDIWHRLFGQDVTAWGPTHVQMIGGASLATLASWALLVEGQRAATLELTRTGRRLLRASDVGLAGAFLIGASTLQVEFDFGVPQFRQLEQPVLIAVAAGVALVAARIRLGRFGALATVAFFLAVRGALSLGIAATGRVTLRFPLYLAAAVIVEVVAAVAPARRRPVVTGAIAGFGIGTIGFATEWAWSRAVMPIGWSRDLLPAAVPVVAAAGTGAGVLGALIGGALTGEAQPRRVPRAAVAAAWLGVLGAIGLALPMSAHSAWRADLAVQRVPGDPGLANLAVRLDPPDAAEGAAWFYVLWWQGAAGGGDGGTSATGLVRQPDGSYLTPRPVPIGGSGKTLLRLHTGSSIQSAPIYLPEDRAIPAPAVEPRDGTVAFVADKKVLQREATTDNVALERVAYALLGLVAAAWLATMAWGLHRLGGVDGPAQSGRSGTAMPGSRPTSTARVIAAAP